MQLAAYGVGLEALRTALSQVNVNQPTGYVNGDRQRISITTSDQLFGADAYKPLIIATDKGSGQLRNRIFRSSIERRLRHLRHLLRKHCTATTDAAASPNATTAVITKAPPVTTGVTAATQAPIAITGAAARRPRRRPNTGRSGTSSME